MRIWQLKTETPKLAYNHLWSWLKKGCFSLNIQNIKNYASLFWNVSADSLDSGPILDDRENNTSALLYLTMF